MKKLRIAPVVLALVVGMASPGSAALVFDDLPRGEDTHVPHLVDTTIFAGGESLPLPESIVDDHSIYTLVGRTDRGWVVYRERYSGGWFDYEASYLVTADGATTIYAHSVEPDSGPRSYLRLSDDRQRLITWEYPPGDDLITSYVAVRDLDGQMIANRAFRITEPLDFSGTRVVFTGRATRMWRIGVGVTVVSERPSAFADLGRNVLVVQGTDNRWRWASLTRPGTARWQARFLPVRISPDGKRVAGWSTVPGRRAIHIRRVSDGKLLAAFDVSQLRTDPPRSSLVWEGSTAILFEAHDSRPEGGRLLVRCTVTRVCNRATDPQASRFSFPFEGMDQFHW